MPGPLLTAAIPAAIGALGSVAGGYLSGKSSKPKETKLQRTQRHLIDKLIKSLTGKGPFADLYDSNPETFEQSFLVPAQNMFRNKIAPQIQQQYVQYGQQRGTGLDDQLLRAGIDLDSMLNQQLYQFNQDVYNRKQNTLSSILGGGPGAAAPASRSDLLQGSIGGYLQGDAFKNTVSDLFKTNPQANPAQPPRKGFEPDWRQYSSWGLGDPRWGR